MEEDDIEDLELTEDEIQKRKQEEMRQAMKEKAIKQKEINEQKAIELRERSTVGIEPAKRKMQLREQAINAREKRAKEFIENLENEAREKSTPKELFELMDKITKSKWNRNRMRRYRARKKREKRKEQKAIEKKEKLKREHRERVLRKFHKKKLRTIEIRRLKAKRKRKVGLTDEEKLRLKRLQGQIRSYRFYHKKKGKKEKGHVDKKDFFKKMKRRKAARDRKKLKENILPIEPSYYMVAVSRFNIIQGIKKRFVNLQKAMEYIEEFMKPYQNIRFPKQLIKYTNTNNIFYVKDELLLLESKTASGVKGEGMFRNEIGTYTENVVIDNKRFKIVEKWDIVKEETFYIPSLGKNQRRDFMYIFNTFLKPTGKDYRIVSYFKKWLIIEMDNSESAEVIVCKTEDDAERLHFELSEEVRKWKIKNIVFKGTPVSPMSNTAERMRQIIMDKTGVSRNYIRKSSSY